MDADPLELAIRAAEEQFGAFTRSLTEALTPEMLLDSVRALEPLRCPIEVGDNDFDFVRRHGILFDGRPFDWHRYKHLVEVYEDDSDFLVLQAGAQTGKTGRVFVKLLRTMLQHYGSLFGFFFPTQGLPEQVSTNRLLPFWMSNPAIAQLVGATRRGGVKGVNNVLTRTLGESVLYLMTTAGKASTESNPLQGVFFDEVRRMEQGDVERAMERYSAKYKPVDVKVSTAQFPKRDINLWFLRGDQRYFHTACGCPRGVVLAEVFPECILDLRGASPALRRQAEHAHRHEPDLGRHRAPTGSFVDAVYRCPNCDTILDDPREGWWEPRSPGRDKPHSYHMPQMLSPTYPAGRMLYKYEHSEDDQEFINSGLGLATIDETKRVTSHEAIEACIEPSLEWPANRTARWRKQNLDHTALGADVQRGYLVVVIKQRTPLGKHRTVHLAMPHGESQWRDLGHLMDEYNVGYAVIDAQPEWDSALRFARHWRGRVWLANFTTSADSSTPMAQWKDLTESAKAGDDVNFRHTVSIEKVKGMRWSLGRWRQRTNELPHPRDLVVRLPVQGDEVAYSAELRVGRWQPYRICRAYMDSMTNIMVVNKLDDQVANRERRDRRNQRTLVVEKLGPDHFADANLYADVAMQRLPLVRGIRRI